MEVDKYPNSYDAIIQNMNAQKYNDWNQQIKGQQEASQPEQLYVPYESEATKYSNWNDQITEQQTTKQEDTQKAKTPDSVLSDIFSDPPAPKYDEERQKRIQTISKVNAIGEGLKVLGDVFSLSKGANVIARQPNQDVRQLYGAWQNYEDAYANRMDQYNRALWNAKLQSMYRGQEMQYRRDKDANDEKWRQQGQANTNRQFEAMEADRDERRKTQAEENEWRKKQVDSSIKAQEANTAQGWGQLKISQQRADADQEYKEARTKGKVTEDKDQIILSGASIRDVIKVDKRFRDKILALIVEDKLMTSDDFDLMKPRFGQPVTSAQKDYLIAKYWQQSPAVIGWLNTSESRTTPRGTPTEEEINSVKEDIRRTSVNPYSQDSYSEDQQTGAGKQEATTKVNNPFEF